MECLEQPRACRHGTPPEATAPLAPMAGNCHRSVLSCSLIALLAVALAEACHRYPPQRPATVPPSAEWAGGIDGGEWVDCSEAVGGYNHCQVFEETKGLLLRKSQYLLKGLGRPATRSELRYRYVSGTEILLQGGLVLVEVPSSETVAPFSSEGKP